MVSNQTHSEFSHQLSANHLQTRVRNRLDIILLTLILTLLASSLFMLYSVVDIQQDPFFWSQVKFIVVGLLIMTAMAYIPMKLLMEWSWVLYAGTVFLLILVPLIGESSKGAQRWLNLGIRFQPSELMKIALPLFLSSFVAKYSAPIKFKTLVIALLIIAVPLLLILKQPDLGSALLITSSGIIVIFIAGLSYKMIVLFLFILISSIPVIWNWVLYEYQQQRILTLLNPSADKLGSGWHIIQSKIAIGSGGWFGKGWQQGTQSQLDFLPESHTDFILSVVAEEFGLRGILILFGLYLLIVTRGLWISYYARTLYNRLLGCSIVMVFFVYMFVNAGMVAGILPVVGVPLPLVSYGGTSLLTLLIGFGVLMAIAHDRPMKYSNAYLSS